MVKFCPIMKSECLGLKCIRCKQFYSTSTTEDCSGRIEYHSNKLWRCEEYHDITFFCSTTDKCITCRTWWCGIHPTGEPLQ